jgi:TolB-like protein
MEDRRLAAIMFTDIVGYTALMGKDEDQAFKVLRKNREIQKAIIKKYRGEWLKEMGDGILACFHTASDAVRCAGEIQHAAKKEGIPLRIGIHEGEVVFEGSDVFGEGVNIASRLEELAEAGSIQISGAVYKDIKNKSGITTELVGEQSLKNIDDPVKIYKVTCGQTVSDIPSPNITVSNLPDKKSIIVLPFENISPDPDQEYFSDGLTEEIITDLSRIHDLLVISRTSAMMFKGSKSSVREIAEKVNVRYVLEGSVRKAGNNLRITAQLIDGINDSHLWAEKYSGTRDDIFDIQEKVSQSIVQALRLKLTSKETKTIAKRPIENIEAYEYYLKGQSAYLSFTEDGLHKARQYYEAALKITGDNGFLYAAIGKIYLEYAHWWIKQEDSLNKAEEYARKALELDPEIAQAYMILACCQLWSGITKNMVSLLKKGYSIDPNDIFLTHYYGWSYIVVGRTSEALPLADRIIELDPFNPLGEGFLGVVLFYMGKFMEAAEMMQKFNTPALLVMPMTRFYLPFFLVFAGKTDEALDVLEPVEHIPSLDFFFQNARLLKYALEGKKEKIDELMTEEFILAEKREGVESCWAASFFAILGDFDTSLDWLENSVDRGFFNYPYMAQYDPFLTKMQGTPRYDQLMERVKREWEDFKV